jgi:acetoin utilization protein AcuC
VALIYHDVYDGRGFSRLSDSWRRYALARQLFREIGLLPPALEPEAAADRAFPLTSKIGKAGLFSLAPHVGTDRRYPLVEYTPNEATDAEILRVHRAEHLANVRAGDERGSGFLDYGDTPAWTGVLRRAKLAVGGTLLASRLVATGQVCRAFNPAGGLHHARHNRAGGFCPFNDLVIAVRALQVEHGVERIAIVDLDGHHGDGTEALLLDEPILTVSMHRYDGRFYPGTGSASDTGRGAGLGYNLNVPLERGTNGEAYLAAFDRLVEPAVRRYRPEIILVQVGADSHTADPLVHLRLDLPDFRALAERVTALADDLCDGRIVAVAGGGYAPEHVARCWAVWLATLSSAWSADDPHLAALYERDTVR